MPFLKMACMYTKQKELHKMLVIYLTLYESSTDSKININIYVPYILQDSIGYYRLLQVIISQTRKANPSFT